MKLKAPTLPVMKSLLLLASASLLLVATATAQAPAEATPAQRAAALYQRGLQAERDGDIRTALAAYASAVEANPHHTDARFRLGHVRAHGERIATQARERQFGQWMVDQVRLDKASLQESLAALTAAVRRARADDEDFNPPVFLIQDPDSKLPAAEISFQLENIPASAVLGYILEAAGAKARFDEHAIVILPR